MKRGELDFIRQMNELEIQKAKELGEIEARACSKQCVGTCGVLCTLRSSASASPWMCNIVLCVCVVRVSPSVTCDHRVSASQRVQVSKFAAHVEAIGTKTIQAVATSGPESQVSPIRLQPLHCLQVHWGQE